MRATNDTDRPSAWIQAMSWSWAGWMGWCMPTAAAQLWVGQARHDERGQR